MMTRIVRKTFSLSAAVIGIALLTILPVAAGDTVLTVNTTSDSTSWFISGEASLVMNGFDLNALGIARPAVIDKVSISVDSPTPGVPVEMVIYEDANGGSPSDATLAGRRQVDITASGVFTVTLDTPITINQPAVWIGFYLPVDFSFFADTSGSSVLTYWAWTPGGTFDLNNLSSAAVIGPADGSAPVSLNMNGKARITAEITGAVGSTAGATTAGAITQTAGASGVDLNVLATYPLCENALWDTADEFVSLSDSVNMHCREVPLWQSPANPDGYVRRGPLYDIIFYKDGGVVAAGRMDVAVTHCIRPEAGDLASAVIGNAFGVPRQWHILPSQRFGDLICAEVRRGGNLSYFVPFGTAAATTP